MYYFLNGREFHSPTINFKFKFLTMVKRASMCDCSTNGIAFYLSYTCNPKTLHAQLKFEFNFF